LNDGKLGKPNGKQVFHRGESTVCCLKHCTDFMSFSHPLV